MKKKSLLSYFVVFGILAMFLAGCGQAAQYGEAVSKRDVTEIRKILSQPETYHQKIVKLEGKIVSECPTGCWFEIKDASGIFYVDVNPSGFAIPQMVGRQVIVEGKVVAKKGKPILVGHGVETR